MNDTREKLLDDLARVFARAALARWLDEQRQQQQRDDKPAPSESRQ